jgi:hypothetical protein
MGGLLVADTLIQMADSRVDKEAPLWPKIVAVIAFDTPVGRCQKDSSMLLILLRSILACILTYSRTRPRQQPSIFNPAIVYGLRSHRQRARPPLQERQVPLPLRLLVWPTHLRLDGPAGLCLLHMLPDLLFWLVRLALLTHEEPKSQTATHG